LPPQAAATLAADSGGRLDAGAVHPPPPPAMANVTAVAAAGGGGALGRLGHHPRPPVGAVRHAARKRGRALQRPPPAGHGG